MARNLHADELRAAAAVLLRLMPESASKIAYLRLVGRVANGLERDEVIAFCRRCAREFTFVASHWPAEFPHPKHCAGCRQAKRQERDAAERAGLI